MHIGYRKNKYGTNVSVHRCDACGAEFTVCPATYPESKGWENCLGPKCSSYDKGRDFDKAFDENGHLREGIKLASAPSRGVS